MGLGDAKLLSALGFWFGWISIPFILISIDSKLEKECSLL
ncbi:MAG: hypothetical protein COA74_02695 [Gammaproteobacteria bacterium]|nr:MAG: hypothetical protein COA74_02695 [Gammaproteobacteria bacterium]